MSTTHTPLPAICRQVVVSTTPDRAFLLWTKDIASWWPLETHSVHGQGGGVAFVDGQLVETDADGQRPQVWGTVSEWQPGERLTMSWHAGRAPSDATEVEVSFTPVGDTHTLVSLTHSGWEQRADGADARADYRGGWRGVLEGFAAGTEAVDVSDAGPNDGPCWLVLDHRVGVAAAEGGAFRSPLFAEHVAFLQRLDDRGWLVAAGHLPDTEGDGMTVLRLPDTATLVACVALAHDDDVSVREGLFDVRARPWQVALTGSQDAKE
jgi:uncharacterized protein YciI/uncharacterized protein YndB with AHSA1/START domain